MQLEDQQLKQQLRDKNADIIQKKDKQLAKLNEQLKESHHE